MPELWELAAAFGAQETLLKLARAIESVDAETARHVDRVGHYALILAEAAGLPDADLIYLAAPMHDLGKIAVPREILFKPARLVGWERAAIRVHCRRGWQILHDGQPLYNVAANIALSHHERWDGHGYPQGLAGDKIPVEARVVTVVDSFDAMTSKRVYRPSASTDEAFEEISQLAGRQFDPDLARLFVERADEVKRAFAEDAERIRR